MIPSIEQLLAVLEAARAVLDARENQMLTAEEWDWLTETVAECDSESEEEDEEA